MSDSSNNKYDADLEKFFTDAEKPRKIMEEIVLAPALPKRLLVVHGVGGIGKSSLLRIFRLYCRGQNIPVGLASGDEDKSGSDILIRWGNDFKRTNTQLKTFSQTLAKYRIIQAKVEEQAQKAKETRNRAVDAVGKMAAKTVVEVTLSTLPGIGQILGTLGGIGTDSLIDWLRGFLSKPEIDLLLDPTKKLTSDFINDVDHLAIKQRLVLMLDTYEQLLTLESWTRDLAQQLHNNVLLVIAGRMLPSWDRQWPGWMAQAEIQELKPMDEEAMGTLVNRYYAHVRGGQPNARQRESIIRFARGLPMVVTSAVRLWVEYGLEDFQTIKPEVVADLVDRLLEGIPTETISILEAAAILRWFNKDLLRAVTGLEQIDDIYSELRYFPFVRPRVEGLALHDVVRELINENLRLHDPQRYINIHESAATYFEKKSAKFIGDDITSSGLELLYHRVCADEVIGMGLFQVTAEKLVQYRLFGQLRILLQDAKTYPLMLGSSHLWLEYYYARLAHIEENLTEPERIYPTIVDDPQVEKKLQAYVLSDWGEIQSRYERLGPAGNIEKTIHGIEKSLQYEDLDTHLCNGFFYLARIARYQGLWDSEIEYLKRARTFFEQHKDYYGLAYTYSEMKRANGRRGVWKEFFDAHDKGASVLSQITPEPMALKATLFGKWTWTWALSGRISECEQYARESLAITRRLQFDALTLEVVRNLGWALGIQHRFTEAEQCFDESFAIIQKLGESQVRHRAVSLGVKGLYLSRRGRLAEAKSCLEESLQIRKSVNDVPGMLEAMNWLGLVSELRGELDAALSYYQQYVDWKWYQHHYLESDSISGIIRIKYNQQDYAAIPSLVAEAVKLAQQHEYNDHLTLLYLLQGHMAWAGFHSKEACGFEPALHFYQNALVCAMRYNRFLLDQVLWGDDVFAPFPPLISHCLEQGDEGLKLLIALKEWWQSSKNELEFRSTISPIPEDIPLLEAERLARQRERGDGTPQKSVVEAITSALRSS